MSINNNNNIIISFEGDAEDKAYCNQKNCGGLVVPLNKNGDQVCTLCEHVYRESETKLHKKMLQPDDDGEPMIVPFSEYSNAKKKGPTVGDIADQWFVRQAPGRSITAYEETDYSSSSSRITNQGIRERMNKR